MSALSSTTQSELSADSLPVNSLVKRALLALVRFLITFCIGVAATLAWQSYGDAAREMIANSYPQLGWLTPQAEPVAQNAPDVIALAAPATPSPDQQQSWLPQLVAGDRRATIATLDTEPFWDPDRWLTEAGKPSKCLWCHEINLQPPFKNVTDVEGYSSTQEFRQLVVSEMETIARYRRTLASKVNFKGLQDHSHAEALYMSFAEPTATRLAQEWDRPLDEVKQLLASRNLHPHPHSQDRDDGILGDELYNRDEVDALAPYATIRGPSDMRESSSFEPNLLQ